MKRVVARKRGTNRRRSIRVGVAAVILDRSGRVLLLRRGKRAGAGSWALPGGRVKFGESLRDAIVREMGEEVGVSAVNLHELGWYEDFGESQHWISAMFCVTEFEGEAVNREPDVHPAMNWFEFSKLPTSLFCVAREGIARARARGFCGR